MKGKNLFLNKGTEDTNKVALANRRGKTGKKKLDPPVSQLLMLWGALD